MLFNIIHNTHYRYSRPVLLGPQQLRFYPRNDGTQQVNQFQLNITPMPAGRNEQLDLEGNRVTQVWFDRQTDHFNIAVTMQVETLQHNAFNFLLAPEATVLPTKHVDDFIFSLGYLNRVELDNTVTEFSNGICRATNYNTLDFLNALNEQLCSYFTHIIRDEGAAQSPSHTLHTRHGACRDLAVLFIECCRCEGIAARFASGYQKGDMQSERRHLHAWAEVYLPGAGWRGFDPTHGKPITDTHVIIAAAAHAADTMPVSGSFSGDGATSTLDYSLQIQVLE